MAAVAISFTGNIKDVVSQLKGISETQFNKLKAAAVSKGVK